MSLARLCQEQDKQANAHALLAPVSGWFSEGFETVDLQEARVLLAELAQLDHSTRLGVADDTAMRRAGTPAHRTSPSSGQSTIRY